MKVAKGLRVLMEYELKVKGGAVIESSSKDGPLEYVHGSGRMLPALEKRLDGMEAGHETKGEIPAKEAFPEESLPTKTMAKGSFPKGEKVEVGRVFQAKGPAGEAVGFRVIKIDGDRVEVRFLHPLAGRDIEYKVKILRVTDPTPPPPPGLFDEAELEEVKE